MTLQRTTLLLPCHSLDDLPTFLHGSDATSLLAAWTVLWHPALLAASGRLPEWRPADDPPDPLEVRGHLFVVPTTSLPFLPEDWPQRLLKTYPANPAPITELVTRHEMIASMQEAGTLIEERTPPELVADFFALGYAYLQIELLTRAMHYGNVLDVEDFRGAVESGAKGAVQGDLSSAQSGLERAFDLLTQTRQHYYPVDFFLIDITLLADSTSDKALRTEINSGQCANLLATGAQIEMLKYSAPSSLAALRTALDQGRTAVVGGPYGKVQLSTAPPESLLLDLVRGRDAYRHLLGHEVNVFGQFVPDRCALLPQALANLGFTGALLTSFDGSRLPNTEQTKSHWQGADGQSIDVLVATPHDVGQDETFLALSNHIGNSMQHDHVATLLMAGWPGNRSQFYNDLCRISRYGPVLGRRVTLSEYFATSANGNVWSACKASPNLGSLLVQDVAAEIANPISARVREFREETLRAHDRLLHGLSAVAAATPKSDDVSAVGDDVSAVGDMDRLREFVVGGSAGGESSDRPLAVNAWSFPRRIPLPPASPESSPFGVAQVPGFGYVCRTPALLAAPVCLAEDGRLRNELCEVQISQTTGGIESFKTYRDRSNRISQRLVCSVGRGCGDPSALETGIGMLADSVEVSRNDDLCGEITAQGKLIDEAGQFCARFVQRFTLLREDPCLRLRVSLHDVRPPRGDPWKSYLASRVLWRDIGGNLYYGENWIRQPAAGGRVVSPEWIEIQQSANPLRSIALIPHGLAFHKRVGDRGIDSLLAVDGETATEYEFAFCLDTPYLSQQSLGMLTPAERCVTKVVHGGAHAAAWLMHVSAKNVIVTGLEPMDTVPTGLRMRILETEGRSATAVVSGIRPFASGTRTDFGGHALDAFPLDQGRLVVKVDAFEWLQLEGRWEPNET